MFQKSQQEVEKLASDEDEYVENFFVPERSRWSNPKRFKTRHWF